MKNIELTPIQQERLIEYDAFLKMDLPEIIDDVAWMDAITELVTTG